MSCAHGLHRFALATVGSTPYHPFVVIANGITRSPELRRDTCVSGILQHSSQFAMLNFIGEFDAKLEVQASIIDTPAFIDAHLDAIVGVSNQVIQCPSSRLQTHIRHANHR